ncbi:MAG: hypothetical protein HC831_09920 [Chloroflexia bacterium]|nr:hypothetical protein [Chloroflexia bacterium]
MSQEQADSMAKQIMIFKTEENRFEGVKLSEYKFVFNRGNIGESSDSSSNAYGIQSLKYNATKKELQILLDGQVNKWSFKEGFNKKVIKNDTLEIDDALTNNEYRIELDRNVNVWSEQTGKLIKEFKYEASPMSFDISPKDSFLIVGYSNGEVVFWDLKKSKNELVEPVIVIHALNDENEWLITAPIPNSTVNYYAASKSTLQNISYRVSKDTSFYLQLAEHLNYQSNDNYNFGFDQFDLIFNRPDTILEKLLRVSSKTDSSYHDAYIKRLEKMGFSKKMEERFLNYDIYTEPNIPLLIIDGDIKRSFTTSKKTISVPILAVDLERDSLIRILVNVNDVPIYGLQGKAVEYKSGLFGLTPSSLKANLDIDLQKGINEIGIQVLNSQGMFSYEEKLTVECTADFGKPNLYILGIGASNYKNIQPIHGAANDIREFVDLYKSKEGDLFNKVIVDTLLNNNILRNNVLNKKDWFQSTNVNDIVIIYYSGHGKLTDDKDYYLYSYDVDIADLAKNCIRYNQLESFLDGIPARRKLFLINACFSGEYDKNLEIFKKMKETFPDLRAGTGAMVIASSYADKESLTGSSFSDNNTAFGFSLESILRENKSLTVNELKQKLEKKVYEVSMEMQEPTYRSENLEMDFRIW